MSGPEYQQYQQVRRTESPPQRAQKLVFGPAVASDKQKLAEAENELRKIRNLKNNGTPGYSYLDGEVSVKYGENQFKWQGGGALDANAMTPGTTEYKALAREEARLLKIIKTLSYPLRKALSPFLKVAKFLGKTAGKVVSGSFLLALDFVGISLDANAEMERKKKEKNMT